LCSFNWDQERINLSSIKHHFDEFDYIQHLQKELYCNKCGKRQAITSSYRSEGVEYCACQKVKSNTTKETDSGWIPYLERKNMITWRREERKGLYAYKVYVKYDDVSAEDFLFVQTDVEYRKKWDSTAVTLEIVEKDPKALNSEVIYWEMAWPKLFANRDYVFVRRYFVDRPRKLIVIVNKNSVCQHPNCPIKIKNQRVNEYWSYIVIKSTSGSMDRPGLEFVLTYFDNPGLSIPKV
jgi:StAR-related lipid transfer protein 7, mitochondrial